MIEIEIVNWRSYVARGDIKNISWFKLSSDIAKDKKFYGLSPGQKWAFIVILCEACKDNSGGLVSFTDDCLLFLTGLNRKDLEATLQHFKTVGLIDIQQKVLSPTDDDVKKVLPVDNFSDAQTILDQTTLEKTRQHRPKKTRKSGPPQSAFPDHLYDLSDSELELGRKWLEMAINEMPHRANDPKWHGAQFAEDLVEVKKHLKYTDDQMRALFHWVSASAFWRPNACSPKQLLKVRDDGLRKIDTIIAQMKSPLERKANMAAEARNDPDRPLQCGGHITLAKLRKLQGLPLEEENQK